MIPKERACRQFGCLSRHFVRHLEEEMPTFIPPGSVESALARSLFLEACVPRTVRLNKGHKKGITCSLKSVLERRQFLGGQVTSLIAWWQTVGGAKSPPGI